MGAADSSVDVQLSIDPTSIILGTLAICSVAGLALTALSDLAVSGSLRPRPRTRATWPVRR